MKRKNEKFFFLTKKNYM